MILACFVQCFEWQSVEICFVSTGRQDTVRRFRRSDQKPPLVDIATQVRDMVADSTPDVCRRWSGSIVRLSIKLVDLQMQLPKAGRGSVKQSQLVQSQATLMLHVQSNFQRHRLVSPSQYSPRELQANAACAA